MPTTSPAQERLMQAAAHKPGGFAGVPQNVGQEFVADAKGHAAGTLYVAPDGDVLLLHRARDGGNFQGHFALPGGGVNEGETPETAADREAAEEMGGAAPRGPRKVLDRVRTPTDMVFHTFVQPVTGKFTPRLNDEHTGFAWAPLHQLPSPIHPAVRATLDNRLGITADMQPADWDGLREGLLKWLAEEEAEPDHAEDAQLAFDRSLVMAGAPAREGLAFDRASVRDVDPNGYLHVAVSNISKAAINPYLGREIPKWKELGLEPERLYQLLRDPEELARAAPSFNNLPILSEHQAISAEAYPPELTVGSTGTDAEFSAPYLRNSLVIWPRGGIEAIKSNAKRELSSAYRYRADMTPGVFEGKHYDGVMRDIVGNHVALVEEGRAGDDVVVGDSKEGILMKPQILTRKASLLQGAIAIRVIPLLAQDAKLNLIPALVGVTAKKLRDDPKPIALAIHKIVEPLLAKDKKLSLDDVEKMADLLNKYDDPAETGTKDALETDPASGAPMAAPETMDADPVAAIKEYLRGKGIPDEVIEGIDAVAGAGAQDDPPPFPGAPKPGGAQDADTDEDDDEKDDDKMAKDAVTKPVMVAAIKSAVQMATDAALKQGREIRDAERAVRPYVGELAVAMDSAEAVFRHALKTLDVKGHDTIHASALQAVLEMQPVPGSKREAKTVIAQDAAMAKSYNDRFPGAQNIRVV